MPEHFYTFTFSDREVAAIRAGLDLYWCHAYDGFDAPGVKDAASNFGMFEPLSANGAEALIERLKGEG